MMKMELGALLQMELKIAKYVTTGVVECVRALEMIEGNYFRDPNDKMRHGKLLSRKPLNNHNCKFRIMADCVLWGQFPTTVPYSI